MSNEKIVSLFVDDSVLIRLTNNIEDADYCITPINKKSIREYLVNHKIFFGSNGFNYLVMAITIACQKIEDKNKYTLSKEVYPLVAQIFCVTTLKVEMSIWNAIGRSTAKDVGVKRFIENYKLSM